VALLLMVATGSAGQGAGAVDVRLAWDRNPEPAAAGYYVYVGTLPGVYDERLDAGDRTSFVYSRPADGRRYYFSVAAYTSAGFIGPKSEPVSHVAEAAAGPIGGGPVDTPEYPEPSAPEPDPTEPDSAPWSLPDKMCFDAVASDCYFLRELLRTSSRLSELAATDDGRVIAIANGDQAVVLTPGETNVHHALSVRNETLTGVALDPAFSRTHFVYVGQASESSDGASTMAIVRYREVQGTLGEPAVVVQGIRVPAGRSVPFEINANGDLYVATPAPSSPRSAVRDPYAAAILRFTGDGRVPPDMPGVTPVYAQSLAEPVALARSGAYLWIAGRDDARSGRVTYLNLGLNATRTALRRSTTPAQAPATSALTGLPAPSPGAALLVTPDGNAVRCEESAPAACMRFATPDGLRFTAITQGPRGLAYAAIVDAEGTSTLVELRPRVAR
jgi:hypothetical protein